MAQRGKNSGAKRASSKRARLNPEQIEKLYDQTAIVESERRIREEEVTPVEEYFREHGIPLERRVDRVR
jgi:hypothetical protein